MAEEDKETGLKRICIALYGMYATSAVMQFAETTLLAGLLILTIAYILTKARQVVAQGTLYASHLRWMYRTFWIGAGVIVPVAVVLSTILILTLTDITSIITTMDSDDPAALLESIHSYLTKNMTQIILISSIAMIPTILWWIRRCWVGYALLRDDKPVENVTTWL